jgi:hypothetical protein
MTDPDPYPKSGGIAGHSRDSFAYIAPGSYNPQPYLSAEKGFYVVPAEASHGQGSSDSARGVTA